MHKAEFTELKQFAYASQYGEWVEAHPNSLVLSVSPGAQGGIIILYVPKDKVKAYREWRMNVLAYDS